MAKNDKIMALPLASKFRAEARKMADAGMPTYQAIDELNRLEENDKERVDAIMALHEHEDYQPFLRAMANTPCIDVEGAKEMLRLEQEKQRPPVPPELTAAFETFMAQFSPPSVSGGLDHSWRQDEDEAVEILRRM